ncbi:MAG: cation:proton antiporter [Bacteroidota bacterium]
MNIYITIIALGLLIFLSPVFNELFDRTKIPNVLLLLLIWIIIGPVSGIVSKDFFGKLGNILTTITLIVILFESGSGLNFKEIRKAIGSAAFSSYVSRWLLSIDVLSSVFIGAIVGGTSSAVVIPMVKQMKLGEKSSSVLILESALSNVLCLVVCLPLQRGLAHGEIILDLEYSIVLFSIIICSILVVILGIDPDFFSKLLSPQNRTLEDDSDLTHER